MTDKFFHKTIRIGSIMEGNRRESVYCFIKFDESSKHQDRLSITGVIGPRGNGDAYGSCGQIDSSFKKNNPRLNDSRYRVLITADDFNFACGWNARKLNQLMTIWELWHLNDTRAGCVHQTHKRTHVFCDICVYSWGHAWMYEAVPDGVINWLRYLPNADHKPPLCWQDD